MNSWILRIGACMAIVIAGALGFGAAAQDGQPAPVRTLKVNEVARIGERVITAEEFIQRLTERERITTDPDRRSASAALESLMIDALLELESARLDATPKTREVNAEYDRLIKKWETDEFNRLNEEILKQKKLPYSKEEYVRLKYDMTVGQFEDLQRRIAQSNIARRLVVNYWLLSTESAKAYGIMARSKRDIDTVMERLTKGESFSLVARECSEDMYTREHGGEIGTVRPLDGALEPELEEPFWDLEESKKDGPTKLSAIIKTSRGYWILKKADVVVANEAEFYDQRLRCIDMGNVEEVVMLRWSHAIAASGRYAVERRMPGWDCQAGEQ